MHVSDFLAAAVQLTSGQDPELNFNAAEEQIDLAARRGAELIGLPENFAFMGCLLYTSPSPRDRQKSRMPSSA